MNIMKHLMRYEGYTSRERVDDILDKISKYGMMSLTSLEKEFLNSFKTGEEEQTHDKIAKEETESIRRDIEYLSNRIGRTNDECLRYTDSRIDKLVNNPKFCLNKDKELLTD